MAITRIIDIENNLADILVKSWQGLYTSYTTRLLVALKAGNKDAATKIANSFSLVEMLKGLDKSFNAYTNMAFKFGSQQISSSPTSINDLHDEAINLLKTSITQNVVVQVKKASMKVISDFDKVKKAESILHEFQSFAGKVRTAAEKNLRIASQVHTSRLAAYGFTAEANVLGIMQYSINGQLDNQICSVCRVCHGRIFQVSDARNLLKQVIKTRNPDDLKALSPWPSTQEAPRMVSMSAADMVAEGWHLPTKHANCRCLCVKLKDVPELSMEAKPSSVASGANKQRYVPNKWDFTATGLDASPDVLAAWGKAFGVSPMQLIARLFGEAPGLITRDLLQTRGFLAKLNQRDLEFEINNRLFGSAKPIAFKGSVSLETKSALLEHLYFEEIDAHLGMKMVDSAMDGFKAAGVDVVNINANVGQGSFALARLGWCPRNSAEWLRLKKDFISAPWKAMRKDLPPMVQNAVDDILASKDPQAIWDLSDIGYQVNGKGLGQTLLEDCQWWGALDLTDAHAMIRYNTLMGK